MSYQVLARKYRPRRLQDVVGQEHAVRALTHGLDADRLHHAYLFTGTRGVGKTTLARAFANCLNCEQGVSATPCGQCAACVEIAEGRFVDLIEVDAASRTGVDATRELLDNSQYLPGRGRFKVYLIDEVHMLSAASFNALLKTLEEPPPHVKFLLATTDPRKVPVTVLSRCLQFNLKNILPERIAAHLASVLEEEAVEFEPEALDAIAVAAQGSMRDALSVTDQAVAFGGGALRADDVASLLGTVRRDEVAALLRALAEQDRPLLMQCAAELAERGANFADVLANLQRAFHDLALAQSTGGDAAPEVAPFAARFSPEDVQLYYQIALLGGRDLQYAPDARVGFEMTLIRMAAFRLQEGKGAGDQGKGAGGEPAGERPPAQTGPGAAKLAAGRAERAKLEAASEGKAAARVAADAAASHETAQAPHRTAHRASRKQAAHPSPPETPVPDADAAEALAGLPGEAVAHASPATGASTASALPPDAPWHQLLPALRPNGMASALLRHSLLVSRQKDEWRFLLDEAHAPLISDARREAVREAVSNFTGAPTNVVFATGPCDAETPAERDQRRQAERQRVAEEALLQDEKLQALKQRFDGRVESVRPLPLGP